MDIKEVIESLSPNERKIIPYLKSGRINKIVKEAELDKTSVIRALQFLSNKAIIKLDLEKKKIVELGINGILYKRKGLPERRLIGELESKSPMAMKESKLSVNEIKAAIGALKKKTLIDIKKDQIILIAKKEELAKLSLEEQLLQSLPLDLDELKDEQRLALQNLKNRKEIIEINEKKEFKFELIDLGKKLIEENISGDYIEELTSEILKKGTWKGKKFRRYDIKSKLPSIYGGKRHFVKQAEDYARKIWTELGFKEMTGSLVQTGFWNFDALFTAQDHPVREMHDTFYLKDIKGNLAEKKIVDEVKEVHEKGIAGSKGWQYKWDEDEAKKVVLRTHTTCLSAQTLVKLREKKEKKGKYFSIGKVFRNETVDWSHGFEFNQTEGIVIDKNANFRHLLGYLKEFYKKMGFDNIKFAPAYFPYTEPSVEIHWWHPEKKIWLELGGAGIFRPEVVVPLLGEYIPVLAWGPGFDRIIMDYYKIKDLREMYKNDLTKLRKMKVWK